MARVKEMCDLFHHVFDWSILFLFPLREGKKDKKKNTGNVLRPSGFLDGHLVVIQCAVGRAGW